MNRKRIQYILLILATIAAGLFSRSRHIPDLILPYLGDILYALMFYFIIGFLFPKMNILKVAIISLLIVYAIEISQLYEADWINQLRTSTFGKLVLGKGFLWSDMMVLPIGVLVGVFFEKKNLLKR